MKYLLCCAVLSLAVMVVAQQQTEPPPSTAPPYQTPPTVPEGQTPRSHMPPDTQAPPPVTMSDQSVEGIILDELRTESTLSGTNVDAKVDQNSVVLTGSVDAMTQHALAIRIALTNAGDRKVVDKIKVKQQT